MIEAKIDELIAALDRNTAAHAAPAKKAAKGAAPESAPPAATSAAAPAQAPAAAPPAQSPEAPTPVKYTARTGAKKGTVGTGIDAVNFAVLDLASQDRDKALSVLGQFKVTRTPELKATSFQAVIDIVEEELAKIDAAATQASLV
jgi:hypothetical protein